VDIVSHDVALALMRQVEEVEMERELKQQREALTR
jgi:hypothetical protein